MAGMHYGLTFMLLMMNVYLTIFFPSELGIDGDSLLGNLVIIDEDTETVTNSGVYTDDLTASLEGTSATTSAGFSYFDSLFTVLDVIVSLYFLMLALPQFIYMTTMLGFAAKVLISIPIGFTYIYTIIEWVRNG